MNIQIPIYLTFLICIASSVLGAVAAVVLHGYRNRNGS